MSQKFVAMQKVLMFSRSKNQALNV